MLFFDLAHFGALREQIGEITSARIERAQTSFAFSFGEILSGRYHYTVSSMRDPTEIWVTWHQDRSNGTIVVEQIEVKANNERKVIRPLK